MRFSQQVLHFHYDKPCDWLSTRGYIPLSSCQQQSSIQEPVSSREATGDKICASKTQRHLFQCLSQKTNYQRIGQTRQEAERERQRQKERTIANKARRIVGYQYKPLLALDGRLLPWSRVSSCLAAIKAGQIRFTYKSFSLDWTSLV
jgi:hypothetical protein